MDNSIFYIIFSLFSSIIVTLLAWLLKKVTSLQSKMGVLEERISWIIKFINDKTEHKTN